RLEGRGEDFLGLRQPFLELVDEAAEEAHIVLLFLFAWRRRAQPNVVQDPVDERAGVLGGELLGDVDRLVDRDEGRDILAVEEFVGGQPQDVAVDRRHALELPVLGDLLDLAVDLGPLLAAAVDELAGEVEHLGVARGRRQGLVDLVEDLVPAEVELVHELESQLAGLGALSHNFFISEAISSAAIAALRPALPILVPARSIACSIVSVVRTPKMQGTPVRRPTSAMPLAVSRQTWS